jgi:hypothetical protein
MKLDTQAWLDGTRAFFSAKKKTTNPNVRGGHLHSSWNDGWDDAAALSDPGNPHIGIDVRTVAEMEAAS